MSKLNLIFYFVFIILLYSCDSFDEKEYVTQLKLPNKNFDVVVYYDGSGGVFASSYFKCYKKYRSSKLKKLYFIKKNVSFTIKLIKLNDDTVGIIRWYIYNNIETYLDTTRISING